MTKPSDLDSTQRFTDRVEDYIKARPSYPAEAIDFVIGQGLDHRSQIADIGSGTGILTELLLERVGRVYAVEPNDRMRAAAEARLGDSQGYVSVAATAEDTGLPDHSVDLVAAAQAFHWFDTQRALDEFRRILRQPRRLALIWNNRLNDTPFLNDYEALLQAHGTDYRAVNHQQLKDDELAGLFSADFVLGRFDNQQRLDLEGLKGRLFSSSYTPMPGEPGYAEMASEIETIFDRHQKAGYVVIRYETQVYSGRI